ncbi:MAG: hypothetical protein WBN75_14895 [Verrucomicrobiia bacterium]|jgi:hypothetical protein
MNSEQLPAKPSLLQKVSGPLFLFCAVGNVFVLIGDFHSTSADGTVIHGIAIIVIAILGIFLLRRYWGKQ